ncbi:MAG: CatB-related O-acetyltransferase [Rhodobacter sp.]|uniref:CatB-related O-acetyltransferase n=1 Tax=Pararhodobacter sp. TaxID=2127056 RepID=UPI001D4355AE|nr:CatB-related O-acetyltransferase [Pararhodobacter sp.]MCB1345844.1 CatB-related O-acetyltransferase [Paracoccaceae bacterium]MCB1388792.1 CatB-related O-acetyltransferase [Paracoccaceae bacterium]MCC0072006.1 CatB-related O-acetyltransferase [Rhodobacter sp.]HPD93608.1 CatB-related O-acetyltransferase [Pararhodobacter sp.]
MPDFQPGPSALPPPLTRHPIVLPDGTALPGTVFLHAVIDHPNISVGDYAYASDFGQVTDWAAHLAPYLYPGAPEHLRIGRFAQIAHGVRFITSSANHPLGGLSAYPFRIYDMATTGPYLAEAATHGDTVVGPDVWLGFEARVLPGVTIGAGAIVAACAVVTRDVPPYAVVAGNPARVVKHRFPPGDIARLLRLAWWDWPVARILAALPAIEGADLAALERLRPAD